MTEPAVLARWTTLLLAGVVLQAGVFSQFRILGVAPDIMVALAVSAGLMCGTNRGAVVGFCAGMLIDLPRLEVRLGASALAYCLAALVAGFAQSVVLQSGRSVSVALVAAGSVAGVMMMGAIAELFGMSVFSDPLLIRTWIVVGACSAVFARLTIRLAAWAEGPEHRSVAE